jgi:hypothetical protein
VELEGASREAFIQHANQTVQLQFFVVVLDGIDEQPEVNAIMLDRHPEFAGDRYFSRTGREHSSDVAGHMV